MGHVPIGKALRRSGAQRGRSDLRERSRRRCGRRPGAPASSGAAADQRHRDQLIARFLRPRTTHCAWPGPARRCLRRYRYLRRPWRRPHATSSRRVASARISILDSLPLSEALAATFESQRALELALGGGDDYELCFTVPPQRVPIAGRRLPAASAVPADTGRSHRGAAGLAVASLEGIAVSSGAARLPAFFALRRLAGIPERRSRSPFKYLRFRLRPSARVGHAGDDPGITSQIAPDPIRILPAELRMGNSHS